MSNLSKLIKAVNEEFKKAEKSYKVAKKSAEEVAETSRTSWSQAGDRYHSQGSADLAKQKFESISSLKKEIEQKGESIVFKHNGKEIFLVENPILIKGFTLVSTNSPLGIKLFKS